MLIKVTISGLTPILMNRFTEENEVQVSSGTRSSIRGSRGTSREQAEPKAYIDKKDGHLYIPGPNIFAAIVAAGTFHKAGKVKITTQKTSLIPAGVMVEDLVCPLIDNDGVAISDFEVDSRSVVIPSTGGRVMCHRPRVDEWNLTFTLDVDTDLFDSKLVRSIVDDAGKKIGLGDYRPSRKGPFGRFVVTRWVEETKVRLAA